MMDTTIKNILIILFLLTNSHIYAADPIINNPPLQGNALDKDAIQQHPIEAIQYLKMAADQNLPEAQYVLGDIYKQGKIIPRDLVKSVLYYEMAALQKCEKAKFALQSLCKTVDKPRFIKSCIETAEQGDPEAQLLFILTSLRGGATDADFSLGKALDYIEIAVKQEYPLTQIFLRLYYEDMHYEKTFKGFKTIADKEGGSYGQFALAYMYKNGCSVAELLYFLTIECMKASDKITADLGQQAADAFLWDNYFGGELRPKELKYGLEFQCRLEKLIAEKILEPVHQDINQEMAFKYCNLSADQGFFLAPFMLATMYEDGCGVSKDIKKAFEYYKKSAKQGYFLSPFTLWIMYQYGWGVPKDIDKTNQYSKEDAQPEEQFLGHPEAQFLVGDMYEYGYGVPKNLTKAFKYYKMAADQGDPDAQYCLGLMHEYGYSVPKNIDEALKLYKMAAYQGLTEALIYLGTLYELGDMVPQDLEKATRYFKRAKDLGNDYEQLCLGEL